MTVSRVQRCDIAQKQRNGPRPEGRGPNQLTNSFARDLEVLRLASEIEILVVIFVFIFVIEAAEACRQCCRGKN
jgi:hypothetical protein